jgi:hypothetical protein
MASAIYPPASGGLDPDPRSGEKELHMAWLKRLEAAVALVLSRWVLSASSPRPAAFTNPWSPGTGSWRYGERAVRVPEPPFTPFDMKPLRAEVTHGAVS